MDKSSYPRIHLPHCALIISHSTVSSIFPDRLSMPRTFLRKGQRNACILRSNTEKHPFHILMLEWINTRYSYTKFGPYSPPCTQLCYRENVFASAIAPYARDCMYVVYISTTAMNIQTFKTRVKLAKPNLLCICNWQAHRLHSLFSILENQVSLSLYDPFQKNSFGHVSTVGEEEGTYFDE